MHTIEKGDISTAMITARCLKAGYTVLRPVSELSRYDLVIDRGFGFERVQCKTGRLRGGGVLFKTCSSMAHHKSGEVRSYVGEAEFFGVYCPGNDETYLVPVGDVGLTQGRLRVEPAKNNQSIGVTMAAPYRL